MSNTEGPLGLVPQPPPSKELSLRAAVTVLVGGLIALVTLGFVVGYTFFWNHSELDRVSKDLKYWQAQLDADPKNDQNHLQVGWALYQSGKKQEALKHYEQAIELVPGNVSARYNRALTLKDLGKYEESKAQLQTILDALPRHELAQFVMGEVYYNLKQYDASLDHFNNVLVLNPTSPDAVYYVGLLRQAKGDMDGAAAKWKEALTYDPKHDPSLKALERVGKR